MGPTSQQNSNEPERTNRAELEAFYAAASTPKERRRWQVLLLLADATPLAEVVATTGYQPRTIRQIVQRYRESGPAALADQKTCIQGAAPLLSPTLQRELWHALQDPPSDNGIWTGPKVAQWMSEKMKKPVHRQRGWEYLCRISLLTAQEIKAEEIKVEEITALDEQTSKE